MPAFRFPKMAILHKYRALKLGYEPNLAEAIGIAQATKYTIFKHVSYSRQKEKEYQYIVEKLNRKAEELEEISLKDFDLQALDGFPFVGHKSFSSQDYQRAVFGSLDEESLHILEEWAKEVVENCTLEQLKDEKRFFYECWLPNEEAVLS